MHVFITFVDFAGDIVLLIDIDSQRMVIGKHRSKIMESAVFKLTLMWWSLFFKGILNLAIKSNNIAIQTAQTSSHVISGKHF